MRAPDVGTLILTAAVLMTLCAVVMFLAWRQNRAHTRGISYWFASWVMQAAGVSLMALRDAIPEGLSIIGGNLLLVAGTALLYEGLRRYVGKAGWARHNVGVVAVFIAVHAHFTFSDPYIGARDANLSAALLLLTAQCVVLLMRAHDPARGMFTREPALVLACIALASAVRIPVELAAPRVRTMFELGAGSGFAILAWQVLFVALTLSLLLTVNRRLVFSLEEDIRERERAQEALRVSEELFSLAFQNVPDGILVTRVADGHIVSANEAFYRATGHTPDETIGRTTLGMGLWFHPEDRDPYIGAAVRDGSVRDVDAKLCWKSGQVVDVVLSAQVIDIRGERHVISIIHDVTERTRAEEEIRLLNASLEERVAQRTRALLTMNEELIEANVRLDDAMRARGDFLNAMSHELRTPLNSIIGYSDLLVRGINGELPEEQRKHAELILGAGRHLLDLVNEVLDHSAIEAGTMTVERRPVDVRHVVRSAIDLVAHMAQRKGLTLSWHVADDVPALTTDGRRLKQVLLNLLGNAIKFTEVGSVDLAVRREGHFVKLVVTDTGRGIAPDHLPRVFEQFFQAPQSDVAKSEGTGLGLTVSRNLAEMLGGELTATSELGAGSAFTVSLPAA